MSKRNLFFLFVVLIILALVIAFYLYKENQKVVSPQVINTTNTEVHIKTDEELRTELLYLPKSNIPQKTDTQIRQELKTLPKSNIPQKTDEEIRGELQGLDILQ